jgi:hypothetical protein
MAEDKKVAIEVEVKGTGQSIESLKDLKAAIKAAKDEQVKASQVYGDSSKEFIAATKRVSDLKDKVEDLADSTKSLKGSGVERASEGFNQLGEGLRNLDFEKVKVGLVAMKSALAAVGIGLIVQLVSYLIENFDELSQGTGILAKVLQGVGKIITYVTDEITKFTDAIGLSNSALDKQGEAIKTNADNAREALSKQTAEYDRQIAIAKASGKSAVDLEKAKQQAIIESNKALIEQTIAYVRQGGVLDAEQRKLLDSQLEAIKGAVNQQKVVELTDNKERLDKYKKHLEDKNKAEQDAWNKTLEIRKSNREAQEAEDARIAKEKEEQLKLDAQAQLDYMKSVGNEENAFKLSKAEFDKKLVKLTEAQKVDITRNALQSVQQLSDIFFMFKSKKAAKGSKEEEDLARKQFNFNKGLQLGLAAIDGFKSITASLAQSPIAVGVVPNPAGIASLAFASITAATNIAKIAASQFKSSGGGGGGVSAPSAPNISVPPPPVISTASNNLNSSTSFDENGKRIGGEQKQTISINATIGVDEVKRKMDKVDVLEKQSTF